MHRILLIRSKKMQSCGSPDAILDGKWYKCKYLNDRPSYYNNNHYLYHFKQQWYITTQERHIIAVSHSFGLHPLTIRQNEWAFFDHAVNDWYFLPQFHFFIYDFNQTFTIDDLGEDFFVRTKMARVVKWIHPETGVEMHSGAKGNPPGKKWCLFCKNSRQITFRPINADVLDVKKGKIS